MRDVILWNTNWRFEQPGKAPVSVCLPHTWNAVDGQDGGNDYFRGICTYRKEFDRSTLPAGEEIWIELRGAANSAEVYLNDCLLGVHHGGYSTFRFDLTQYLQEGTNRIEIRVDNSANEIVYPQKADFTFYGGIYRDVYLIGVPKSHFSLDYYGAPGIAVTPMAQGDDFLIRLEARVQNAEGERVTFTLAQPDSQAVSEMIRDGVAQTTVLIRGAHRWDGKADPYLYHVSAVLGDGLDQIGTDFGCRTFEINAEKGFVLNGRPYPLRGVSRHQDREGTGNALTARMHEEDIDVIDEIGANSVRAAHYQHDQHYYDLLDQKGYVVWAEIPYITFHMEKGRENTISQMRELILQNYNHPGIVCWALSNEITASTKPDNADMLENHKVLKQLCRELDPSRPTVMAHTFLLDPEEGILRIPDVNSYNLYYGWYVGELEENDEFFDRFHEKNPDLPIGLSEFGADANPAFHAEKPSKGDYTEEYQCIYHEHMLRLLEDRPWIWCGYVWNLFDFGADGRGEGGNPGRNQKGLICMDHRTRKDAFYAYKAYWSQEPFVHVCGRRFVNRCGEKTLVRVYSNQESVSLYVNGTLQETKRGSRVYLFEIPLEGTTDIAAVSGTLRDAIRIHKVPQPDESYHLPGAVVHNWFEDEALASPSGFYSIRNKIGQLRADPATADYIEVIYEKAMASRGDVAKSTKGNAVLENMINNMRVEALLQGAGNAVFPREEVIQINQYLNQIPEKR